MLDFLAPASVCGGMTIDELRADWDEAWGRKSHARIGRTMLEKSLAYKEKEKASGGLSPKHQIRLDQIVKAYRKGSTTGVVMGLKPGTQLVRLHDGKKHTVRVLEDGFEYNSQHYKSLSKIANEITGSKWNGYIFFGLKKVVKS